VDGGHVHVVNNPRSFDSSPAVEILLEVKFLKISPYILSESTCTLDCVRYGFFANETLFLSKSTRDSLRMCFGLFLNECLDFK
jgi:hypothetical protein